ncbi:hypothetical protein Tco_1107303 [Tanacetum coccineum]
MTALYTPQQNGISEKKYKVLKDVVNFMLSYLGLSEGFWGKDMAVVKLPDPKLNFLGERDIECIFVRYAKHSKAFSTLRLLIALASIHNLIIPQMDVKTACLNGELDEDVDLTKEFSSSKFSIKDMGKADVILGIRIKHESNRIAISRSHYIEKEMFDDDWGLESKEVSPLGEELSLFDRSNEVERGKILKAHRLESILQQQISQRMAPSHHDGYPLYNPPRASFSRLFFGTIGIMASKKKTCITSSTIEYEFMALAAADKEVEWLRNLILEIPLWSKPIAPIYILGDSAATLARDYSQMYNGMSRHLGVRHRTIHELILNRAVSIKFVTS